MEFAKKDIKKISTKNDAKKIMRKQFKGLSKKHAFIAS